MDSLKKIRDNFVNQCQKTSRIFSNEPNAVVQVEFKFWKDGNVKNAPEISTFIFPPPSPEQQLGLEVAALRAERDEMQRMLEESQKQLEFLRLEATK